MNIFAIWDEQIDASLENINYLSLLSVGFVLFIYLTISIFGYITFFNKTPGIITVFFSLYHIILTNNNKFLSKVFYFHLDVKYCASFKLTHMQLFLFFLFYIKTKVLCLE
jgi:hypothetical protein